MQFAVYIVNRCLQLFMEPDSGVIQNKEKRKK